MPTCPEMLQNYFAVFLSGQCTNILLASETGVFAFMQVQIVLLIDAPIPISAFCQQS